MKRFPTAPIAAAGMLAAWAAVDVTGSRPVGGIVLLLFAAGCVAVSRRRDELRTTAALVAAGAVAFVLSHVVALVTGAWPAVVICALGLAAACWRLSDARALHA